MVRYLMEDILLQKPLKAVGAGRSYWLPDASGCCTMQERGSGEATHTAGARHGEVMHAAGGKCRRHHPCCLPAEHTRTRVKKAFPSAVSLQHLLLTTVNIMLAGKGNTFKGPEPFLHSRQ